MNGMTILASEVITKVNPIGLDMALIGVAILFFSIILLFILNRPEVPIIIATIGAILSFGLIGWACVNQVEDYIQYDVLISEEATFKEIHEKYEILGVKGEIYTVKEIEIDD